MKMFLQTLWPLDDNREIVVDRFPFVIGRRTDTDWSLPLAFVSRRHCQFTRSGGLVMVQDLESYNGTFVNGKRAVTPLPVQNGDEVTLGPCSFRVSVLNDGGDTPALLSEAGTTEALSAGLPHGEDESTVNAAGSSFPRSAPNSPKR
jgi:pSer/pThr/pTyr-binding forkhead associated (FHA) protein